MNPTLSKHERLVSRKLMEQLFGNGRSRSATVFPLRVVYLTVDRSQAYAPLQVLVSVPKRHFKHAVDRNRVKRQVREAFRQNKQTLYDALPADSGLIVAFVWLAARHYPSADVEQRVVTLMHRVAEKI